MCDDVRAFVAEMESKGVACSAIQTPGWGMLTQIRLPGGGKLGVYQPRHARPEPMGGKSAGKRRTAAKKTRTAAAARRKSPARPAKPQARGRR
jgi:hypothetical protein